MHRKIMREQFIIPIKQNTFRNLYKSTQAAALQDSGKNKFQIKGRYESMGGDRIQLEPSMCHKVLL